MRKMALLIILAALMSLTMTGCLRSAATVPAATPTLAFSLPTQNVVTIAQTATAIARIKLTGTPSAPLTTPGIQSTNPFFITPVGPGGVVATNTPIGPVPTKSRKDYSFDPAPGAKYPRISIGWVDADMRVGIRAYGFPTKGTFTVSMGVGPRGGTTITSSSASSAESFTAIYDIPAALKGVSPIYIRIDFPDGTWAVNWFYNVTTQ